MARRSARIASISKAPKQAAGEPTLSSVSEHDDRAADIARPTSRHDANPTVSSPVRGPKTPGGSSPIKPPMAEMHPSKVHATMAPPSSGLRLGFTDIKPTANRDGSFPSAVQTTPSRVTVPSSPFTFRSKRQTPAAQTPRVDLGLGPDAQRMMDELRVEAANIKEDLRAKHEAEKHEEESLGGRKIAQAKGKAGRYSAAHIAAFKKMDSIANHPSTFRNQPGRMTPLKAGIKRSQSKANLDEPETAYPKLRTPAAAALKPTSSAATTEPVAAAKRARQNMDEDASSKRPVSRDGSSIPAPRSAGLGIPRSKSNLASLSTPTKSSLSRSTSVKTPSQGLLARSPSKATLSGIPRSATINNLGVVSLLSETEPAVVAAEAKTPRGRFDRVKAMLRGAKASASKTKSALPMPSAFASKTPAPARPQREILAVPMTTPGRKLTKRVAFTPETQRAALTQNSPSPVKSCNPQSKRQVLGEVHYPSLEGVMAGVGAEADVSYPELSARRPLPEPPVKTFKAGSVEPPVPGEFTFRSDHTISFGITTKSFGSSPGQASVRAVRPSILPSENMPGSFPSSANTPSVNKENEAPRSAFVALPHGMSTKKRHRVSTDEEEAEQEAAERAAKKRRQEKVPEGDALLAPRLVAAAASAKRALGSPRRLPIPGQAPGTPSPMKRKGISLSRLNMLARPKTRK
ncbi:hypothetical protein C8A00DRAFT_31981 [Chaetomidium leptoderma]|uniref:Erythromycin esterase n=1 Tax=Chaetomidium leptoderma TaxID=669021 RepID=A0AAN6ZYU4_9PEZI|nr:hypothetical protein C8A00DRAFT_31981 [Chaetomidium leptoderma]